uniref:Cellular retinoic acid-binding protein 1 n=1 Tax=Poecilia reticulata TaxID=8081 RepID=A0A3P9PG94_POERE
MPVDMNGYWKMVSNDNFEDYMKALGEFTSGQPYSDLTKKVIKLYIFIKKNSANVLQLYIVADVNVAIRKIALLLKPDKDIVQDGDHLTIKTLSTFKNYNMDFHVGKEFEEDLTGVDDRKCMTTVTWEGDKLVCVQKGEIEGRGWTQWVEGDQLHLELRAGGAVCKQVFKKT